MNDAATKEWEAWHEVCRQLLATEAVTKKDLETRSNAPAETPGLQLIEAIRRWGELRANLYITEGTEPEV